MQLLENISLKRLNTFGLDVQTRYFSPVFSESDLLHILELCKKKGLKDLLILGGGSNILFTRDFPGLVVFIDNKGISEEEGDNGHVLVKAAAGEIWDDLVSYCLSKGYGGLENLSMIPGKVGAGPIQNIGAYGVELKDHFYALQAVEIETGITRSFSAEDCRFGYRDSVFKQELKGKYIITSVTFRLDRNPQLNISYGAIAYELMQDNIVFPGIRDVASAVRKIRSSKLPDPEITGNAGSFFKNPTVSKDFFEKLKADHPDIPGYPQQDDTVKLAAGWLIEQRGWKGYREEDAGVHEKQALVLVNLGKASGNDIFNLSERIRLSVLEKFDVELEREVSVI